MFKRLYFILLLFLSLYCCTAEAQKIRFTHLWNHTDFGFDLNQLYNYNRYEHNRWGGGFYVQTPLKYDSLYVESSQNVFYGEIGAAWGIGDHAWKYHAVAELQFPRGFWREIGLAYYHDIEKVGNHSFASYNIFNTSDNGTYLSSHFSFIDRFTATIGIVPTRNGILTAQYRHSGEQLLFHAAGLLFPSKNSDEALPKSYYDELLLTFRYGDHWTFLIQGGIADNSKTGMVSTDENSTLFSRLLAQYNTNITLGDAAGQIDLFAQAGTTGGANTPFSRRFDVSGTGGSYYWFRNTFLTVYPNRFMSDAFVQLFMTYTAGRPIWNLPKSKPRLFVRLGAMWGSLYGDHVTDGTGVYNILTGKPSSPNAFPYSVELNAPYAGLLEPALGIDYLVHWGVINIGVAVAYQVTPKNVVYHLHNFSDNFAVMCVARLDLEKL